MIVSLTDYKPSERYDGVPWTEARIEGSDAVDGVWATVETITLDPVDADPANPQTRNFTTDDATGDQSWFRVVFLDEANNEEPTNAISIARRAFATVEEVAIRMGRALTDAEQAMAEYVTSLVTRLIAEEVYRDEAWAAALDPVPPTFQAICVNRAVDAIGNPNAVAATTESLGAYSFTTNLQRASENFACLSAAEGLAVRRAWFGQSSTSFTPGSILDDLPIGPNGRIAWDRFIGSNVNGD